MTKDEMRKEIKFPILVSKQGINMRAIDPLIASHLVPPYYPNAGDYIICIVRLKDDLRWCGVYQWQKENNPVNILAWSPIGQPVSPNPEDQVRMVEYVHLQDDNVILIINEEQKDLIIKE